MIPFWVQVNSLITARKRTKVMFLQVSVCPQRGAYVVAPRGGMHGCWGGAWLLPGGHCGCSLGECNGCSRGAYVVALGGMHGCSQGACMVAPGGVHGCSGGGGHAWLLWGGMLVASGGGGMHGCSWGACVIAQGACVGYDEIRRYGQ